MASISDNIFSMTGFGSGRAEENGIKVGVEARSVNHRGLKLNIRSRPPLGVQEKKLRDLCAEYLNRGAVDFFVNFERLSDDESACVRPELARSAVAALRKLSTELNLNYDLKASDLLAVPGLFEESVEESMTDDEWPALEIAARSALEQMLTMRRDEGVKTAERLNELVQPISEFIPKARERAGAVVERAREKLQERLKELCPNGAPCDDNIVEREICILADRADINEEMDRLTSHISQFEDMLGKGGEVGKRMEFLAQEFLREVNTCASKANDAEMVAMAVEAKLAVEKMKEQAANLE